MQEFNNQLVEKNDTLTIIDYIKSANEKIHHIEIDFIDDFMNLVNKDECCIPYNTLLKYGVLTNIETSGTVKRVLDQNNDIDNLNDLYKSVQSKTDTLSTKIEYMLHPRLFKFFFNTFKEHI